MLETIEKLLILQDRDRQIRRVKNGLAHIEPERQALKTRSAEAQASVDRAKQKIKELESRRKDLDLEVQAKKELIERYANQQLQTRKNEEYRALAHEIETCKEAIFKIEDQEIALMEQGEETQKELASATQVLNEAKKLVDNQIAQLDAREQSLKKELTELEANREELSLAVEAAGRSRYERLLKNRGDSVVVGVQHGVCGGCHMKLPAQVLVSCRAEQEIVTCLNCGRILYYTRDMNLAVAD
ncbi:MAG TPA: C4-type zinc ribbon domain-containing protein [Verrucomicrobiae bacterium]|nr:C4-type zinc ribbon domain-containing protein [Verrucomicrobiae bacterium]